MRRAGCSGADLRGSRILTVAGLTIYAWIIYLVGWPRLVLSNWGLQGLVLVDDLAILLPFFAIQLITWSGLYLAERALHDDAHFRDCRLISHSRRGSRRGWFCPWC